MGKLTRENTSVTVTTGLSGPTVHVPHRPINGHGEASSPGPATHATPSVASQKQLEGTGISRKDYPSAQVFTPTLAMVAKRKQCSTRSTVTPSKACSADIYRRLKRRVGRSLKQAHCKRILVGTGKQTAYKLPGVKSSLSSFERVPRSLCRRNSTSGNRQHHGSGLYKQRRRHEVGPTVCPTVENLDLVLPATCDSKSPAHPRPSKCYGRQTIQAGSDHPDRVVPPS